MALFLNLQLFTDPILDDETRPGPGKNTVRQILIQSFYFPLCIPPPYIPVSLPAFLYFDLPKLIGTYLCLYMCMICLFIVMKKRMKKYINRMGQKTGTSNTEKKVMIIQVAVPLVQANQNLNSGSRRAKGRNSFPSLSVVGSPGCSLGSSKGDKKAMKLFNKYIPRP